MEKFDVVLAPGAYEDLDETVGWLSRVAPEKIEEWLGAIKTHLQSLSYIPERCPYAPENGLWGNEELRQLLFQNYPSKYRIIFTVSGSSVHVLTIRHGARRYLHEEDL